MSTTNDRPVTPPPAYSFVGSPRPSPPPSVSFSPPPYHETSLDQGGPSNGQIYQSFPNPASPHVHFEDDVPPPRLPQRPSRRTDYAHQHESANWAPAQRQGIQLRPDDIVIPVMGMPGSGKSSFISLLADGHGTIIGHSPDTKPIEIHPYLPDRKIRILLLDIPSFTSPSSNADIATLTTLSNLLAHLYTNHIRIGGLIYLHPITSSSRLDPAAQRNLRLFTKLAGPAALPNILIATTMWNHLDPSMLNECTSREKQLREHYWAGLLSRGSMLTRHDGSARSAEHIVRMLLGKRAPVVLDIQQELVVHRQQLGETAAGQELYAAMREERQRYGAELMAVREEMESAVRRKDFERRRVLGERDARLLERIRGLEEGVGALRMDFKRLRGEVRGRERERERDGKGKGKKHFGRTAVGIGVGAVLGLTTGIFI
ncbi:hypothetical protein AJ79_08333 [Helicocarpus griseus UAMH5409]|uniref:G domain-containing protein n=1 Tax=Helicocarpus griseus UAMH5409 TaxID=1447875 RepID=A0A2B7WU96_9EURO|nr:hypothetical protein AJ79_08333 [Helicocarpus griseus UAMH5409]